MAKGFKTISLPDHIIEYCKTEMIKEEIKFRNVPEFIVYVLRERQKVKRNV